jgi:ABC-2 type transport system permease protein
MNVILHMLQKEFLQIFRDRAMLAIIFVVPIVQLLILSFAVTTDVKHIKLTIVDLDKSPLSREIIQAFSHTEKFDLVGYTGDLNSIDDQMRAWETQAALIIPPNFSVDWYRGQQPQIQITVDGVDGNTAGIALGYAHAILLKFVTDMNDSRPTNIQLQHPPHLVEMVERMWYNPELDSQQYMVPGIVVILLTILPMMLSAMSLVKEKEIGTLEQLMVTPLRKHQLLMGKIIPFLLLSYIEMAIVMTVAILVFKIPMTGSYTLLAFLSLLYLMTTVGLGIFISTITNTQQQAMFVAWFFMVFMIIMSGFFVPIQNMPVSLQNLTYIDPMRFFLAIIRDIFQKGSGLTHLYMDTFFLGLYGIVIISMAIVKFRKRVS